MPCKRQPGFASEAQHRLFRAKAARGEIPQSSVEKRVRATEKAKGSIKALPEKISSLAGMFFSDRKLSDDGMFFKEAKLDLVPRPKPEKTKMPSPDKALMPSPSRTTDVRPGEGKPKVPPPPTTLDKKPLQKPPTTMYGIGCTKKANVQLGYPGTGISGSAPFGTTPATTGMTQSFGAGKKPKKAEIEKKALSKDELLDKLKEMGAGAKETAKGVAGRLAETGSAIGKGAKTFTTKTAPEMAEKGLKGIENLPPWAHALMVGGAGYGAYRVGKRGVKGIARLAKGKPKPPPTMMSRFKAAVRALRGR